MDDKICHLLISYGHKNQNYTKELLDELAKRNLDEHFVYAHKVIRKSNTVKVLIPLRKPTPGALKFFIQLYSKDIEFRQLLRKVGIREVFKWLPLFYEDIHVLHVHHAHAISVDILNYFKTTDVKIVLSLRGRDLLVNTLSKEETLKLKNKLKLVDHIHTISKYMNNILYQKFQQNGRVIYRGQIFPNANKKKQETIKYTPLKLLVVGRLVWEKGHIFLLESIFRLKERGFDLQVDIYGEGEFYEMLLYRINQLNLKKEVSLKGFLNNTKLKKKYKDYDVFVQPSLSEALSNALVDAMYCNLPCVITKVGGMPEIITHNKNGIVVDPKNMWLLDQAILDARLLQIKDIKEFNDKINREKFSRKFEIDQILKLYNE